MFQTVMSHHIMLLSISRFDKPVISLVISSTSKVWLLNNAKNIIQERKRLTLSHKNNKWSKKWRYLFNLISNFMIHLKVISESNVIDKSTLTMEISSGIFFHSYRPRFSRYLRVAYVQRKFPKILSPINLRIEHRRAHSNEISVFTRLLSTVLLPISMTRDCSLSKNSLYKHKVRVEYRRVERRAR